jgi:hypothetical protein
VGGGDAGTPYAAELLADRLAKHGDIPGASSVLHALVDAGDEDAAHQLARLLAEQGDIAGVNGSDVLL